MMITHGRARLRRLNNLNSPRLKDPHTALQTAETRSRPSVGIYLKTSVAHSITAGQETEVRVFSPHVPTPPTCATRSHICTCSRVLTLTAHDLGQHQRHTQTCSAITADINIRSYHVLHRDSLRLSKATLPHITANFGVGDNLSHRMWSGTKRVTTLGGSRPLFLV